MGIIGFTLNNPVKVTVGVILVLLFGTLALFQIPIQLTPNVDEPKITVTTRWPGKSAREIAREIVERQEEKLKGVPNLRKMTSESVEGLATVSLEFFVGANKDVALNDVRAKMEQVTSYPPEVEKPEIVAADSALASPIAWILFYGEAGQDVSTYRDFVWDEIKPLLERVPGLASVDVYGGREREVHIEIDPAKLAAYGLTARDVEMALLKENRNISAGTITSGKSEWTYRVPGEFDENAKVEATIVSYRDGGPICVGDLGKVVRTYQKLRTFVRSKGVPILAIPARRETGANVIEVMDGLKAQITRVNNEILNPQGMGLELTQVYDETVYIKSAISLVRDNLLVGGTLAMIVLLVFLRSLRATGVVAVSIPISVVGTCLAVALLGRNINVVMLAGMAFAVGMVVDNAVVVLENIYRHLQMGKKPFVASLDGANEVWGAVLASTLTTLAVFLPVIFIEEEAGQLFRDIAIAISAGVGISLLVSVLVIPTLAARVLSVKPQQQASKPRFAIADRLADGVTWINRRPMLRIVVVVVFMLGSLIGSWWLMPPTDYLPSGNRNLVFGFVITEPGLGLDEFRALAMDVENYLRPYWDAEPGSPEAAALPPVPIWMGQPGVGEPLMAPAPLIGNFFIGSFNNMCFMGAISKDEAYVKPLEALLTSAIMSSPYSVGSIPFVQQRSIFETGMSSGNSVQVEIRGDRLSEVIAAAGQIFGMCNASKAGFPFIMPSPMTFDLARPEIQAVPDRVKAADLGLNVSDLGFVVSAAVDGAYVGPFKWDGDEVDMRMKFVTPTGEAINNVRDVPIYTGSGNVIPLASVVDFQQTGAPQQINRIEEMPGVSLSVVLPPGMALEAAMAEVDGVINTLREQQRIPSSILTTMAGNADKLVQTRSAMFGHWTGFNFASILAVVQSRGFLALLIVYLLMAALFESFIYPIAIILTVPLAMVGGFLGLALVHWQSKMNFATPIQQLDVVTMLGFVILLGIVVNNAILIVHQTLNNLRSGLTPEKALHDAVRTRIRPIFMTAFTSIGGMIPLALMSGPGSELYRGLAGVMVGGLFVSTMFTIILVPVVFSWVLTLRAFLLRMFAGQDQPVLRSGEEVNAHLDVVPAPVEAD